MVQSPVVAFCTKSWMQELDAVPATAHMSMPPCDPGLFVEPLLHHMRQFLLMSFRSTLPLFESWDMENYVKSTCFQSFHVCVDMFDVRT